jgi:putative endonuclease
MGVDPHIVYILRSEPNPARWYTGVTSDVCRRLGEHNQGLNRHTASGRPWRLIAWITFDSSHSAKAFELYLKTGSGRAFAWRHFRHD